MAGSIEWIDVGSATPVVDDAEGPRNLLPCASRAVLELDLDRRIRAAKEGFCSLLGYRASDLVGRYHDDIISASAGEAPSCADFWQLLGGGESVGMEYGFRTRDDREIRLRALYGPKVDGSGRLVGFLVYSLDVPRTENDAKAELVAVLDTELRSTLEGLLDILYSHLDALRQRVPQSGEESSTVL